MSRALLSFSRGHFENHRVAGNVECLHDFCMVCASSRHEGQALDDRGFVLMVDCIFRVYDPGARQSHRASGDVGLAIENLARGHFVERIRSLRRFFHEGKNYVELRCRRAMLGGCGVFHVSQMIWLFSGGNDGLHRCR
ncbi:MAG: hypothetical protein RLZZ553_1249 [Verrucomicrobiota bacterium]